MSKKGNRTGSVLMEFVIVLPIYMLLLGFAFLVGEVSLHAINLAPGDRLLAMMKEAGWSDTQPEFEKAISPTKNNVDGTLPDDRALMYRDGIANTDSRVSSFNYGDQAGYAVNPADGAWSMMVAATVKDRYTLTPWTRGMLMFWIGLMEDRAGDPLEGGSALHEWMKRTGLGRVEMVAKDLFDLSGKRVRQYGYYTLMRKKSGRKAYRTGTGGIVDAVVGTWYDKVYAEPFFENEGDFVGIDKNPDDMGSDGSRGGDVDVYQRYPPFVDWSE